MSGTKKCEKPFWKTVLTVTIVTDRMLSSNMALDDFARVMYEDGLGMTEGRFTRISPKQAAKLCLKMAHDPEFFGIDDDGKELGDGR